MQKSTVFMLDNWLGKSALWFFIKFLKISNWVAFKINNQSKIFSIKIYGNWYTPTQPRKTSMIQTKSNSQYPNSYH